jgi:hypothetical protein
VPGDGQERRWMPRASRIRRRPSAGRSRVVLDGEPADEPLDRGWGRGEAASFGEVVAWMGGGEAAAAGKARGRPVVGGVAQERGIDSVREWGAAVGRVWHASVVWCRKSIRVMVMPPRVPLRQLSLPSFQTKKVA